MKPRVIFPPNRLKLTREQEDVLMDHVKKRHDDTWKEMGKIGEQQYTGWLEKRQQAWAEYVNDFQHRKSMAKYGPLYSTFNDCSLNVPKRAINTYKARAADSLLGPREFASLIPEGSEDEHRPQLDPLIPEPPNPIKQADRYFNDALELAKATEQLREGIKRAAVGGECVHKITLKQVDDDGEDADQLIWLDGAGQPMRDALGRLVYANDKFEDDPDRLEGEILSRDPSVVKLPDAHLSDYAYPVPPELRKQLDIHAVDYAAFVCSPTAECIHRTDYIAHEFDLELDQLRNMTHGRKLSAEAREWVQNLGANNTVAQTDPNRPQMMRGEIERQLSAPRIIHCAESWLRFDARESGISEEICVLWDIQTGYPVHYDVNQEVTPTRTKRRPFECVRIVPVPNRWYGMGFYDVLSTMHAYIDRQVARLEIRTSTSGRFTYIREGKLKDVEGGWDIELNSPKIYTATTALQPNEKPLEHIELPPMDEKVWDLLNLMMQQAQLHSGTMLPSDVSASGLNKSDTLGEQELLANESELLSGDTTQDLRCGIEEVLRHGARVVFTEFDQNYAAELLGAQNAQALVDWLQKNPPKTLLRHVKLTMTKARSRVQFASNTQALQTVVGARSWADVLAEAQQGVLPPDFVNRVKPLFRGVLESNDIEGADTIIEIPPPPPPMPGMPVMPPGPAPVMPPNPNAAAIPTEPALSA